MLIFQSNIIIFIFCPTFTYYVHNVLFSFILFPVELIYLCFMSGPDFMQFPWRPHPSGPPGAAESHKCVDGGGSVCSHRGAAGGLLFVR